MKVRKKPVVVEAVRVADLFSAAENSWHSLPAWVSAAYEQGNLIFCNDWLDIKTLEGWLRAELKDWLIQGVKGELYPLQTRCV
jgi:hypothetical protein